jgi:hypothetical protein
MDNNGQLFNDQDLGFNNYKYKWIIGKNITV